MALTRKLLKGMGLTDEQVDTIIEAHADTVDGLSDRSKVRCYNEQYCIGTWNVRSLNQG